MLSDAPLKGFRRVCANIFGRNFLVSLLVSIFLNFTCINSLVLFATGKWIINLGNGDNVHEPDFVWRFWIVSTVVIVSIGTALAVWECWRFKRLLEQTASGELRTIPYIEIDAPSLGVMEGEDEFIYGKALGLLLKRKLALFDYFVPDIVRDEVGWNVIAERDGFRMTIDVFGFLKDDFLESVFTTESDDDDEDFEIPTGAPLELWVRVKTPPRKYWSWTRFRFIDRSDLVFDLNDRILSLLESNSEVTVLRCCEELPVDDESEPD